MPRRSTSVRARKFPTRLLGLIITAVVLVLYLAGNPLLDVVELKTYDMRMLRLPANPPDDRISIAAIDEKSLATIGRWPWSRDTVARIVERLDQLGAHVIVFDVFFSEAEGAGDEHLAQAVAKSGRTVLSSVFLYDDADTRHLTAVQATQATNAIQKHEIGITRHEGGPMRIELLQPKGVLVNIPHLQAAGKYAGHININPDGDGSLRWAQLIIPFQDRFYASGDIHAIRAYAGGAQLTLRTKEAGIEGIEIGNRFISTDERGRALIRYYGPERTFTTFSASDVLNKNFDARLVKDRIVLLGATAKGIGDIRVTPYSPAFPGPEVRATIMQNLMRGDFISRPDWMMVLDIIVLVGLGVLLSFFLPRLQVAAASGVIATLLILYVGTAFFFFKATHVWLNVTYPAFLLILLFVSTTLVQYFLTEAERRHIKSAFQHYVHPKLVEEVIQDVDQLKLGGDKRELSVLFSDIRGFTSTSETMAPEELVRLLNQYLTRMTDQVFRYDGYLDKYIGDAVMAVYGAPIQRTDHAVRACLSALDMMRELRKIHDEWRGQGHPLFEIGIGVNTGPMIVGNMGSARTLHYSVIGDAVNLGSRIESLNKTYGTHILISEFTYSAARDALKHVREIDITQVKGREAPVRIYELIPDDEYRNLDWLGEFGQALGYVRAGQTTKAVSIFEHLVKSVNDPVSSYYLNRVQGRK